MKTKEKLKIVKRIIKEVQKDFGKPCKDFCIGCPICTGLQLKSLLEWYLGDIGFDNDKWERIKTH